MKNDYTREQLEKMIPSLARNQASHQKILDNLSDKNLLDICELSKLDPTHERLFYKNYISKCKSNFVTGIENIDSSELRRIYETYYVSILKDFINIRPTYIFGKLTGGDNSIIIRDAKVYDDILKYVQDLYFKFISQDNIKLYKLVCDNDFKSMSMYLIEKYNDVKTTLFREEMKPIHYDLRYINIIPFVGNCAVSIRHQESIFAHEYTKYIKITGLRDLYSNMNKENSKREKSIDAIKVITEFIESDEYDAVKYFYADKYPNRNLQNDYKLVKEFDPDLYNRYIEKAENTSKIRYTILQSTGRKLRDAILQSKYKLPLFEFFKIYNPNTLGNLVYYKEVIVKNVLQPDTSKVLSSYFRNMNFKQIYVNDVLDEKLIVSGKELDREEKEKIIKYIRNNKLPFMYKLYFEIYRMYINGTINLDEPFNNID